MKRLTYDPESGKFFDWNGGEVGSAHKKKGYVYVQFEGEHRLAHRVAWKITYGKWPEKQIDHINGNRADNRIANLREATGSQNNANARGSRRGAKGVRVAVYVSGKTRYRASIQKEGKRRYLGAYATEEEAHAAYVKAAKELFGEFANAGTHAA